MKAKMSVFMAGWIFLLAAFLFFALEISPRNVKAEGHYSQEAISNPEKNSPTPVRLTVILQRVYLDGEVSEEVVTDTFWSMEDFWAKYDQWHLIDRQENQLTFQMNQNDISPLLKANGYFGVTEEGILTIFNGKPHDSRIIQSFFQIDLGKLESRKRELLKKGIPVKSKDRYEKVLETFKPYSIEEKLAN